MKNQINQIKSGDKVTLNDKINGNSEGIVYGVTEGKFGKTANIKVTLSNGEIEFHSVSFIGSMSEEEKSIGWYK